MLFYRNMAVHVEAVQVQLTNQKSWEKGDRGRAQRCDFCSVSLLPFLPPHPEASMVMLNCLNRETLFFGPFHSSVPLFASSQPFALFQPLSPTSQPITPPNVFSSPESLLVSLFRPPSPPLCDWASFFDCWPLLVLLFRSTIVWHVSFLRRLQREHLIRGLRCAGRRNATTRW